MSPRIQRNANSTINLLAIITVLALFAPLRAQDAKPQARGALSPEQALKEFRIDEALKIELVAAEPEIESPVSMAFDEDGKLWVVEMRDYPNGPAPGQPPQGRIKILEDRDGDGRYETSRLFADELLFANGLLPWDGGVIVTAAPNIMFLKDTDGDGKADVRKVLYEGFAALNPQLRVSHPILGLDGWIYVANGLRGGQVIKAGDKDAKPINLSGMDFRFNMLTGEAEAISGMGQFGNTFDDWGRRFVCDNRHHLRHVVIPNHYIKRNPNLAVPEVLEDISEIEESFGGAGAKIYPLSKNWTTSNLHAGRFTAACGVFIYRGDLLADYKGCAFTCDPTGNLVHGERMTPHGATFRSKPLKEGVEFLATPDEWTRPVSLAHGPDGALYVVDMARAVIEHPEFMPTELKNRPDLVTGKDKGRIWRIVPKDSDAKTLAARRKVKLSSATTAELVTQLENANAWHRLAAQRLLLERKDRRCIELLRSLIIDARNPLAAVHAGWILSSLDELDPEPILAMLRIKNPRIREAGIILAESHVADVSRLHERLTTLADDSDPRVRFQVALTIGESDLAVLEKIAKAGASDRWTRYAIESSVPNRAGELLGRLFQPPHLSKKSPRYAEDLKTWQEQGRILLELAALVGSRQNSEEIRQMLDSVKARNEPFTLGGANEPSGDMAMVITTLNGLATGMERRGKRLGESVSSIRNDSGIVVWFSRVLRNASDVAGDSKRVLADRQEAVRLLAHADWQTAEPVLTKLINTDPAQEVRLAAVRGLAAQANAEVPGILMKSWKSYTPAVRREVTEVMLRQPERIKVFLDEIEAGRIKPGDIDALRTRQLTQHNRPEIRDRAKELLQENLPPERKQVLVAYQAALTTKGDALRGKAIFSKNCATCHRVGDVGVDVGADIADTRAKTPELLMTNILNPNQAIDSNYINYVVLTKGGKVLTGIIAAETASSITLKRAENQTEIVLRQEIDELESTGQSLMPEGLEKNITIPEMADLLSFLKNWRYLDGTIPAQP